MKKTMVVFLFLLSFLVTNISVLPEVAMASNMDSYQLSEEENNLIKKFLEDYCYIFQGALLEYNCENKEDQLRILDFLTQQTMGSNNGAIIINAPGTFFLKSDLFIDPSLYGETLMPGQQVTKSGNLCWIFAEENVWNLASHVFFVEEDVFESFKNNESNVPEQSLFEIFHETRYSDGWFYWPVTTANIDFDRTVTIKNSAYENGLYQIIYILNPPDDGAYYNQSLYNEVYYAEIEINEYNGEKYCSIKKNELVNDDEAISVDEEPQIVDLDNTNGANIGDIITMGSYEQDGDFENGTEPIEWEVLAKENNRMLLISRYILETMPYSDNSQDITWENSLVRQWLNEEFYYSAFSEDEQQSIQDTTLFNYDLPIDYSGGNTTIDKLFLLSMDDVERYYGVSKDRITIDYEPEAGNFILISPGTKYVVEAEMARIGLTSEYVEKYGDFYYSNWWLRSRVDRNWYFGNPEGPEFGTLGVFADGMLNPGVSPSEFIGIRPAMWITY